MGHRRDDLTDRPVRFWTVMGRYTIIYRGDEPPIEILHVVGPGRDIARLLQTSDQGARRGRESAR